MPGNGPSPSDVLQLYRSIRRLHRHMPSALKFIGNRYVRDEFARHRNAQPEYLPGFIKAWTSYRNTLSDQLQQASTTTTENKINLGTRLDSSELDNFTPEQLGQLYTLKKATKDDGKE
ncbi:hypothetical protein BASA61_003591 [Batrachochytrium salamandrivorans]|nr:hypothetical protein BASA60_009499 [Batrachochytrium salamandrivorans]KAH6567473.1 hypothetical protein BASA62_006103 [Batrachochytrium salamandrivorans]KAH6596048.1 hypothetical protein BASA61_003591 [Batrachochytrium salamandrivorans]KAH9247764.1 hypothetical protein BASA81_014602 [Batrachochytrium salamandrivorans]KAH9265951.1 hypothetical protein BASA83_010859 [Batrachochytrium salamandrivorans]